jgi:hypothetical protein
MTTDAENCAKVLILGCLQGKKRLGVATREIDFGLGIDGTRGFACWLQFVVEPNRGWRKVRRKVKYHGVHGTRSKLIVNER